MLRFTAHDAIVATDVPPDQRASSQANLYNACMKNAWSLLLASRKFWMGLLTIVAVVSSVVLRALDKIPADALLPTISAITAVGLGIIGSIAWEDAASKRASASRAATLHLPPAT